MSNLVCVIQGLPGCGKNYACNKIERLNYTTYDLDKFTQKLLLKYTYDNCKQFEQKFVNAVNKNILKYLNKNRTKKVVLCGVSTFVLDDTCIRDVVSTSTCSKIWLDITPDDFKAPRGYKNKDPELVESTRRGVIREFSPKETKEWRNMSQDERADEGVFWTLPAPGEKNGPKGIKARGLTKKQHKELFDMPLHEFIKKYKKYMDAYYKVQVEDGQLLARGRALNLGFVPMKLGEIMHYLKDRRRRII